MRRPLGDIFPPPPLLAGYFSRQVWVRGFARLYLFLIKN